MIYHIKGQDIVSEYIMECYRRLYFNAVDKDSNRANFDLMYIKGDFIDYNAYYCPDSIQKKIIENTLKEKYVTFHPKTGNPVFHKLTKNQTQTVSASVYLGCSPFSSFEVFCKRNPNFKKYINDYLSDLSADDTISAEPSTYPPFAGSIITS